MQLGGNSLENPLHKYVTIYRITKAIVLNPFGFGQTIEDTIAETKRAAKYLIEGVIFAVAIFQILTAGQKADLPFLDLPFAGELLAALMVGSVLLTGLTTHPFAKMFSNTPTTMHGSFAAFLYWTGFCLFVVPALGLVLYFGAKVLFSLISVTSLIKSILLLLIMVPLLLVYYLGTISGWIGRVYNIEPMMGGLAIIFGYALNMILAGSIFTLLSAIVGFTSF